jgi:hypothetical protein
MVGSGSKVKHFEKLRLGGGASLRHSARKGRIFLALTFLFAFAISLCGLRVSQAFADDDLTISSPPTHHKTITANDDGSYDITLTVTGEEASTSESASNPVDVIIVFDRSNSMDGSMGGTDSTRRLDAAKTAAYSLTSSLFSSGASTTRVALIDFGTYARAHTGTGSSDISYDGTDVTWFTTESDINAAIGSIETPADYGTQLTSQDARRGTTNWEDAWEMTEEASSTFSSDADKYIIFLSDGDPTVRNTLVGNDGSTFVYSYAWYWGTSGSTVPESSTELNFVPIDMMSSGITYSYYGTGSTDPQGYNYDQGVSAATSAISASGATVYGVGVSSDVTKMSNFGTDIGAAATYQANDSESLSNVFEAIAEQITKTTKRYTNVTISDTLSDWAEFCTLSDYLVDGNYKITYMKDGVEYTPRTTATISGKTVTWEVTDANSGDTDEAIAADYELDAGSTYSITFTVWPNQDAYDRAAEVANGTGSLDSGTNWNTSTSSVDSSTGIFSNDCDTNDTTSEDTYVEWSEITTTTSSDGTSTTTTSDPYYDGYEHPVMSVPTSSITVTKVWSGSSTTYPDSVTVKLYRDGEVVTDTDGNEVSLTLTSSNSWTGTFDYAIAAGPDGDGHTYTVVEDSVSGYTDSYAYSISQKLAYSYETDDDLSTASDSGIELQGRQEQVGAATVTNTETISTYSLQVTKKGQAADGTDSGALAGATFELYEATVADDGTVTLGDAALGSLTTGDDGTITFDGLLSEGGVYCLVETTAPAGYVLADPYVIDLSGDEVLLYGTTEDSSGTITRDDTAVGTLELADSTYSFTVTDYSVGDLPQTAGPGVYPLIAGGVGLVGLAMWLAKRQLLS